jgi:hypothetical protein
MSSSKAVLGKIAGALKRWFALMAMPKLWLQTVHLTILSPHRNYRFHYHRHLSIS